MARDGERAAIVTRGLCLDAQPRGEHGVRHGDGSRDGIQPGVDVRPRAGDSRDDLLDKVRDLGHHVHLLDEPFGHVALLVGDTFGLEVEHEFGGRRQGRRRRGGGVLKLVTLVDFQ